MRRRFVLALLCWLLLATGLAGVLTLREAQGLRSDLIAAQSAMEAAAGGAEPLLKDIGSIDETRTALTVADAQLAAAEARLVSAQQRLRRLRPLRAVGQRLPGWPRGLAQVEPLTATALDLAVAGRLVAAGFERFAGRLDTPAHADEPMGARLAVALTAGEPDFRAADARLTAALARRRTLDGTALTGPLTAGARALETFDQRVVSLRTGVDLLVALPPAARAVLGMDGPRTYAILGQNSAEIRPTGGFIGSLGLVTLEHGAITAEDYRGSYTFDNPARGFAPLPPPLARYLGGSGLAIRDANWSPDFPTSAAAIEDILALHQDIRVDGVIGFTTYAVGLLLETLGPVTVDGFAEPVTDASWYRLAQSAIYFHDGRQPAEGYEQNKERVLEPVLRAVLKRIQSADGTDLPRVLRALRRSIRERQVLLAFHDRAPATLAWKHGADGRLAPPPGDVLALVDANVSYSKVGPFVQQRITHEVWFDRQGVARRARTTVAYENRLTEADLADPLNRIYGATWDTERHKLVERPGLFGTYARLYVPAGSTLVDRGEARLFETDSEHGFTVFARYVPVARGERQSLMLDYTLPNGVNRAGGYRLTVIKQPGTRGHALEIRLYLPPELADRAALNVAAAREGEAIVYRGALHESLDLRLVISGNP